MTNDACTRQLPNKVEVFLLVSDTWSEGPGLSLSCAVSLLRVLEMYLMRAWNRKLPLLQLYGWEPVPLGDLPGLIFSVPCRAPSGAVVLPSRPPALPVAVPQRLTRRLRNASPIIMTKAPAWQVAARETNIAIMPIIASNETSCAKLGKKLAQLSQDKTAKVQLST